MRAALFGKGLYPIEITGACAIVILTSGNDLFDLSGCEVFSDFNAADQRCGHNTFVLERQLKQKRNTLVSTLLVLARYIEKYIFPAIAPIRGQCFLHTFRAFGQEKKLHIAPGFDYPPRLFAPRIRFVQKEIR